MTASEQVVWTCSRGRATVRLHRASDVRVVIDDGSGRVSLAPQAAIEIASGIDVAIERLDRYGRLRR